MRWQWSQARLTLLFTGAELLRSILGISTVVVALVDSMVAIVDGRGEEQATHRLKSMFTLRTVRDSKAGGSGQ